MIVTKTVITNECSKCNHNARSKPLIRPLNFYFLTVSGVLFGVIISAVLFSVTSWPMMNMIASRRIATLFTREQLFKWISNTKKKD